jgi:hypothetical protein
MMWEWVTNGEELKAGEIVVAYFKVIPIYADKHREISRQTSADCTSFSLI